MPVVHIKVSRKAHEELCRVAVAKECTLEDLLLESALVECAETRAALARSLRRFPLHRASENRTSVVEHRLHLKL